MSNGLALLQKTLITKLIISFARAEITSVSDKGESTSTSTYNSMPTPSKAVVGVDRIMRFMQAVTRYT